MSLSGIVIRHQGQLVAQYRKALKWSQQDLANALGKSLRTVQRLEQTPMIEDKKRRAFLVKLLRIPAALMALENEELLQGEKAYLQVNDDPMAYLENAMILRFEAHKMGGASTSSLGLNLWMSEVARFVKDAKGTEWHKRALALHREGVVLSFSREGKHQDAVICLKDALDKINGHGFPYLKGYILKMLSQAYARTGQSQECWRSLGVAESVLSQFTGQPERSMFIQREFSLAAIIAQKGVNAAVFKDYDRAIGLIDKGLTNLNPTFVSTRTRLTIQKAEAYNGLEEIDSCVGYAEEALTLARSIGSKVMISRVENLNAALMQSKWKNEPGVRRLGALLTTQ